MGEARSQRLDLAGVLALLREQGHAARDYDTRQRALRGQRHQHGGQTLVAGRDPQHPLARWQGPDQPAQDGCGVVAVSQAVHHTWRALRPPIARIADEAGEGNRPVLLELIRGRPGQQSHLVMTRVIAQRDRRAVFAADAALGAEDQVFVLAQVGRVPTHGCVLRPAKEVAAGCVGQEIRRQRQLPRGTRRVGLDVVDVGVAAIHG